jgi:hypothetical protein
VKLNIKLFRWERALELAQRAGDPRHPPAVLWYRRRWVGGCLADGACLCLCVKEVCWEGGGKRAGFRSR